MAFGYRYPGVFFWTRRNAIDTVVDLELFSRFTGLLTGFCGADRRIGFYRYNNEGLYRGDMLTHRVAYNPHIHIQKLHRTGQCPPGRSTDGSIFEDHY